MTTKNTCRICLETGDDPEMQMIFKEFHEESAIIQKIELCGGIKVEIRDDFPNKICGKCLFALNISFDFRQLCQSNDLKLRNICIEQKIEIKDEPQSDRVSLLATPEELFASDHTNDSSVFNEVPDVEIKEEIKKEPLKTMPHKKVFPAKKRVGRKPRTQQIQMCELCGNVFKRPSILMMHMRRHAAEKPYSCEICQKTFTCQSEINRHMRVHTGARPFKCKYCDRKFADRSTNIKHERTHTNERPFVCTTCGKAFTYSNVLKNHMLTHTGEKRFRNMSDENNIVARQDLLEMEDSHERDVIPPGAAKLKPHHVNTKTKKSTSAPRKLQHEWNHEEIVNLISLVEQHRGLWDVGSAEYKMSRLNGWRNVVEALNVDGIDVNEAKLKWMNLRLSFKTNIKKLRCKNSDQIANEPVTITWKYFSLLKFLEANDDAQSTELTNATNDQSILNDSALDQSLLPPSGVGIRRKRRPTPASTPTSPVSPTPSTSSSTLTTKQMATQVLSGVLSSLERLERCDKHAKFGDFVASELRALPPHESDALRMALMRTVLTFLENRNLSVSQPQQSPIILVDETLSEIRLPQYILQNNPSAFARLAPRQQTQPHASTT